LPPFGIEDGVERLMNNADQVNGEAQRIPLEIIISGAAQVVFEPVKLGDDAIALRRRRALGRRLIRALVDRQVDEVPVIGLRPKVALVVCPAPDRCERMILAEQSRDLRGRLRRQPVLCDFGNDGMSFRSPGQDARA
jgi:hypothetical protein